METGPAMFAGATFALFGAGLLVWTGTRAWQRSPVVYGVRTSLAAVFAAVCGLGFSYVGFALLLH